MADENDGPIVLTVAVLGGTGKEGSGLAMRWALNGYRVIIGSRDAARAPEKAAEYNTLLDGDYIIGMANEDAAQEGHIVVLSVPYSAHKSTIEHVKPHLSGKILVDVTVPLAPPDIRTVHLPEGVSAAQEAQSYVGGDVRVVAAFQNTSFVKLKKFGQPIDSDVLICGDDADAKAEVIRLSEAAGMRGIDAGSLANAVAIEALTPVILYINKQYGVKGAGIRITGIND